MPHMPISPQGSTPLRVTVSVDLRDGTFYTYEFDQFGWNGAAITVEPEYVDPSYGDPYDPTLRSTRPTGYSRIQFDLHVGPYTVHTNAPPIRQSIRDQIIDQLLDAALQTEVDEAVDLLEGIDHAGDPRAGIQIVAQILAAAAATLKRRVS